ncbi:phosphoribosyl 1,2-cyclic phosphodiesterase [Methylovirgula ligni]|uniref:Phosphoribosyl 1,2-cyclic phosphate phosphodiesterase n=1 Tax=Methylovirgula ligni TaxID=569860 RepID=A0A3D9YKV5_9HYPH|nr:MBL fold metallo-hydrolase [Methylovirgula ligni]QAY96744.1 phosphoribosyl 1,2-cyclic phosphodiesterase [Methylovirgula ligni]REF83210.1 phosphoribosyl 1,2-cyclic phosphate phosphodiesterase [Methylovirgula ligni]
MSLAITILGCGSSAGVPRVGQGWGACDPNNPKNRRRRCAIFVEQTNAEGAKTQVLIDMGPDLRAQLLDLGIDRLDAILLTHAHADHTHGIDEVRPLVIMHRRRIDLYMDAPTSAVVRSHFGYIFETPDGSYYPPLLNDRRLTPGEAVTIAGPGGVISFTPFRLSHGEIDALGFRIGDIAYTPDLNGIPVESERYLRGLDLWIVDALRYTPHPSHFSVAETLDWIGKLQPRRAILTNLHTDVDFEQIRHKLPPHVEPAYDGLRVER